MGVARYELSSKMAAQPPPYGASAPHQQGYAPPPQQGYAPPPQQGYAPPPQQAQQPVVVQVQHGASAQLVGQIHFNKHPVTMTCPHCQANITTATSTKVGGCAWLTGLGILFFSGGACCPCAFIPCCVDDFMDFIHTCPSCKRVVGSYQKL